MKCGIVVDNELNNDIRVLREIGILKEQGFEIFVLCYGFQKKYNNPAKGIIITRINIVRKIRDILFFSLNTVPVYEWLWTYHIHNFITRNSIDILHVHDLYMARAASLGIKKSGRKIPVILDLHENYPFTVKTYNWTKGFFRRIISRPDDWQRKESRYLGYASRIIVLSSDFRDKLVQAYPDLSRDIFTVLPNVPDLQLFKSRNKTPVLNPFKQDFPVIFYYGVIAERRGIFDSLEVFEDLVLGNYSVNFLLIGPVDKKDRSRFLKNISRKSLTDRIYYIPWINQDKLPDYLDIVDICLAPFHKNPQHESGVANKIYEYMSGERPVVASDCLPQKTLIEKHNCGLIFKNNAEYKNSLIKLLTDSDLRKTMGKNGQSAVLNEYNTDIVREDLLKLYKTLIVTGNHDN